MRFEDWARSRLAGLLRFAMVLCCDRGLAEDVVQDALIQAHKRWDTIERMDHPEAYVRRIVVNQYLNWRRKWSRVVPAADIPEHRTAPDHAEQHADRAELVGELAKLPPRQRAVLALRYYAGLTDAEIAETLSCRPSTVRSQAARALATLRIELGSSVHHDRTTGASHAH
jgi:RNA polymerase sigma-70 factor (sigma-E family)